MGDVSTFKAERERADRRILDALDRGGVAAQRGGQLHGGQHMCRRRHHDSVDGVSARCAVLTSLHFPTCFGAMQEPHRTAQPERADQRSLECVSECLHPVDERNETRGGHGRLRNDVGCGRRLLSCTFRRLALRHQALRQRAVFAFQCHHPRKCMRHRQLLRVAGKDSRNEWVDCVVEHFMTQSAAYERCNRLVRPRFTAPDKRLAQYAQLGPQRKQTRGQHRWRRERKGEQRAGANDVATIRVRICFDDVIVQIQFAQQLFDRRRTHERVRPMLGEKSFRVRGANCTASVARRLVQRHVDATTTQFVRCHKSRDARAYNGNGPVVATIRFY